ncbi:hypothetical protein Scep_009981 [Stephania cephalantha]|uniref:Uncharacterized protein n=1 Tax=Stephania cephalantha TaxID=152367 RepID=A0AAP0JV78_9MAGN
MEFQQALNQSMLTDMGFKGPQMTWNNKIEGAENIQQMLDRFFSNEKWREHFHEAAVSHMEFHRSNHSLIKLSLFSAQGVKRRSSVGKRAKTFGNIRQNIEKIKKELEPLYEKSGEHNIMTRIRQGESKLERVLNLEEGDMNTKYFHLKAKQRKSKNQISKLRKGTDRWQWVTKNEDIGAVIEEYFKELFTSTNLLKEDITRATAGCRLD